METETTNEYSINWKNHMNYVRKAFDNLLSTNELTDVTLCCEGRKIGAHKILLSACSAYFRETFKEIPCQHPVIILYGIEHSVLLSILHFIYNGEVAVEPSKLESFLMVAQHLQINGLNDQSTHNQNKLPLSKHKDSEEERPPRRECSETSAKRIAKRTKPREDEYVKEKVQKQEENTIFSSSVKSEPSDFTNFENQSSSDQELSQLENQGNEEDELIDFDFPEDPLQSNEHDSFGNESNEIYIEDAKDFEESISSSVPSVLPEKSRQLYELTFERFMKWLEQEYKDDSINENILITYFKHLSIVHKPSSLWSYYSMLRTVISTKKNIDISKYALLLEFLKAKSKGYKPKKTKLLTREDVTRFLREADDGRFLMTKVALIIGLRGSCMREELTNLLLENVIDEGKIFRFVISSTRTKITREFFVSSGTIQGLDMVELLRRYIALRPKHTDHQRFFVSYRNGKCTKQPVGVNTLGAIPKIIASFLKLPNPKDYTSLCFRKSSNSLVPTL